MRRTAIVTVAALLLAACDDDADVSVGDAAQIDADQIDADQAGSDEIDAGEVEADGIDADEVDEILEELEANGFCDPVDVEDLGPATAMHFVVRGELRDPCFVGVGPTIDDRGDDRLLTAWDALADITPSALLQDVSLLAGYECDGCDALAFVSALDEDGGFFLLAVDVLAAEDDPDELLVTMQHELSHVFTQIPDEQLDVGADPDDCATYFNGSGCLVEGSYLAEWVDAFWPDDLLEQLPPDGSEPPQEDAEDRCLADPAFAGPYAATNPDEDFAETYAAYVFDVDLPAAMDDKLAFFEEYPEFVEVRANAAAAGRAGLPYEFERCG